MNLDQFKRFFRKRGIFIILHVLVLLLSVLLVVLISVDTFRGVEFYERSRFQKAQFWICIVFMAEFFAELYLSKRKKHYLLTHFVFFLVAIPYQAILYYCDFHLSRELDYLIRYIPLVRGGYAMAFVVGWFTSNRATDLFFSYLITLLSTIYFSTLTFYLFEHGVNPLVNDFQDALWWAAMDVTTVGSDIVAVTGVGRVLSVLLAALGMMMFPIFTVYVTNLMTQRSENAVYEASIVSAYKRFVKNHPDAQAEASTSGNKLPDSDSGSDVGVKSGG